MEELTTQVKRWRLLIRGVVDEEMRGIQIAGEGEIDAGSDGVSS